MLLLIQIDSTLALSGIRDDITGALIDQDFCYSHLIALYPPAASFPDASAQKISSTDKRKNRQH